MALGRFCARRRIRIQQAVMAIMATATPAPAPMPALAATERPLEESSLPDSPALVVWESAVPDDSGVFEAVAAETAPSVDDAVDEGPVLVAAVAVAGGLVLAVVASGLGAALVFGEEVGSGASDEGDGLGASELAGG